MNVMKIFALIFSAATLIGSTLWFQRNLLHNRFGWLCYPCAVVSMTMALSGTFEGHEVLAMVLSIAGFSIFCVAFRQPKVPQQGADKQDGLAQ